MEMITAGSIGVFLLLFVIAISLLCILTGRTRRSYPTLARSDAVVVAGNTITLEQLASSFQPQLFQKADDYSPPALVMWWEAINAKESIALVFHPVWQDEQNPIPIYHWIYYVYRAIVYGVPVRDIEYIQINISRSDGLIQRVRFEGSSSISYDESIAEHIRITIDRHGAEYTETAIIPNKGTFIRPIQISDSRLKLGIATWSHQFTLLEDSTDKYTVPVIMPLEYLTEENYAKHKLARRSQGDFATKEGIVGRAAKSIVRTVILGLPYPLSKIFYPKSIIKEQSLERDKRPPRIKEIHCPYYDGTELSIDYSTASTDAPLKEMEALPYARDVEIFDPDPNAQGKTNSDLTKIGKDFFGIVNYESIGILHMERGWEVYYCVARCPRCQRLIDVFANFTEGKSLSEMWPHLLAKGQSGDGPIIPWRPSGTWNKLSEDPFFVLLFFIMVYVGSLTPDIIPYFRQPIFDVDHFLAQTAVVCLVRGIVIISLLFLLSIRRNLIGLFRNISALSKLFDIKRGLAYWSNFAVSRFIGYQKEGGFTVNAVKLIGGFSSVIILCVSWMSVRLGMTENYSLDIYSTATGLIFWLVVSYVFGVIVWNLSVVPAYIFRGIRNIPMKVNADGDITGFKVIERSVRYCISGIVILIISAIALSVLPIFLAQLAELRWAIIWAQSALILCFSILIIRFEIKAAKDNVSKAMGATKVILIIVAFILLRYGIGLSQSDGFIIQTIGWLGIMEISAAKKYAELVVFSILAAYLFYRLAKDMLFSEVKQAALQAELQWYDEKIKEIKEMGTYKGHHLLPINEIRAMKGLRDNKKAIRTLREKRGTKILKMISIILTFIGPIAARLIEHYFFVAR
jgi:hypothetical protein